MDQEYRRIAAHRKEVLDQESTEIKENIKTIADILYEFSDNLKNRPDHIVIAEISPVQTKYHDDQTYFNKNHLKQAFNLDFIDELIMSLQQKDRELEVLAKELSD